MRFKRNVGHGRQGEFVFDDQIGLFHGSLGISLVAAVETGDVGVGLGEEDAFNVLDVGDVFVDQDFGCQSVVQVADGLQDLILDVDQVDGLLGDGLGGCGDSGDHFALVAGFALGQGQLVLHVKADHDV